LNLNIKVTNILYHQILSLDLFRFCETYLTTYQRFVANKSANSPFLGGTCLFTCLFPIKGFPPFGDSLLNLLICTTCGLNTLCNKLCTLCQKLCQLVVSTCCARCATSCVSKSCMKLCHKLCNKLCNKLCKHDLQVVQQSCARCVNKLCQLGVSISCVN